MSQDAVIPFCMGLCVGVIAGIFILALVQWSKHASDQNGDD